MQPFCCLVCWSAYTPARPGCKPLFTPGCKPQRSHLHTLFCRQRSIRCGWGGPGVVESWITNSWHKHEPQYCCSCLPYYTPRSTSFLYFLPIFPEGTISIFYFSLTRHNFCFWPGGHLPECSRCFRHVKRIGSLWCTREALTASARVPRTLVSRKYFIKSLNTCDSA